MMDILWIVIALVAGVTGAIIGAIVALILIYRGIAYAIMSKLGW